MSIIHLPLMLNVIEIPGAKECFNINDIHQFFGRRELDHLKHIDKSMV
jgi:hypothetical protein